MKLHTFLATAAALALPTFGGTIVSQTFDNGGSSGSHNGLTAVEWTQTGSYTNVSIFANIADESGNGTATGTAYLVNMIGSGTTDIASTPVSVTGNPGLNGMTQIFSGLTLGPGTYYLVINPTDLNLGWDIGSNLLTVMDSGVTPGATYEASSAAPFPPASAFTLQQNYGMIYDVTGTLSTATTPEPSTIVMLLAGIGAMVLPRLKKAR